MKHEQPQTNQQPSQTETRKPYSSPRLVEYGSVAKLTQGTSTRQVDSTPGALLRRRT